MRLGAGGRRLAEGESSPGWRPGSAMRCSAALAGIFFIIGCAPMGLRKDLSLREYVNLRDDSYSWDVLESKQGEGFQRYLLSLVSQTWRSEAEVDRTLWTHRLEVVVPDSVKESGGEPSEALLIIDGGSNGEAVAEDVDNKTVSMALSSGTIVANLGMVPNQPLGFAPEFRGRYEDDLVAHTWNLYMDTGDQTWLARWPMVKSAVRAMDAVEEFLGSTRATGLAGPLPVSGFIVSGSSKRGWTTWLTGATDSRVSAIIPIVIDVVNVIPSMDHHYASYGFWAPAVRDYEEQGVMARKNEPAYQRMIRLVDPYYYLDQLRMPKYMINAAGDQFFLPDSSRFYFDQLSGEKYLRYVPNTDHSLFGTDASAGVAVFTGMISRGSPRPEFSWSMEDDGSIRVSAIDRPVEARLWHATNPDARDFRLAALGAAWRSGLLGGDGKGAYVGRVRLPEKGWIAFFVELTYALDSGKTIKFTTAVRVLPDTLPYIEKLKVYRQPKTPGS